MTRRHLEAGLCSVVICAACTDSADPESKPAADAGDSSEPEAGAGAADAGGCSPLERRVNGRCVDAVGRYEPADRVDTDNVVRYTEDALTLELPPPPKSGFRLIVPPQRIPPGEEIQSCVSWALPEITHRNVYAARLYTTGMLHHSNMYGVPISEAGPSEYPKCAAGQSDVFAQVSKAVNGVFMDVLFANSTQIAGGEALRFPEGMAYQLTTEGREVVTSIHWLNTTAEEFTSEVVYDFYTMPDDAVVETIVPFVYENQGFSVPAQSRAKITTTCDVVAPGNIVSLMPHTHERAINFTVDLFAADGQPTRIYESGGYDLESDIVVFDEPVAMEGFAQIQHECTVDNELAQELVWGVGDNEMCTLFGYLYPPEAQQLGVVLGDNPACNAIHIGQYR